jgi:hypothetical protein
MRRSAAMIAIALPFALVMPARAQSIRNHSQGLKPALILVDDQAGETTSGVQVLSDTQGVDFGPFLKDWHRITQATWKKLIPPEVNPPTLQKGTVKIRFKILPDGKIKDGSMVLEGRSGFTALDRAAWNALAGSRYPSLPSGFHGDYLELRAVFFYNAEPTKQ